MTFEPVVKTRDVMRRGERVHVTKATRDGGHLLRMWIQGLAGIRSHGETGNGRKPVPWAGAGDGAGAESDLHQYDVRNGDAAFAADGLPKTVYNADLIGNWSNEIGQAIGVEACSRGRAFRRWRTTCSRRICQTRS